MKACLVCDCDRKFGGASGQDRVRTEGFGNRHSSQLDQVPARGIRIGGSIDGGHRPDRDGVGQFVGCVHHHVEGQTAGGIRGGQIAA